MYYFYYELKNQEAPHVSTTQEPGPVLNKFMDVSQDARPTQPRAPRRASGQSVSGAVQNCGKGC